MQNALNLVHRAKLFFPRVYVTLQSVCTYNSFEFRMHALGVRCRCRCRCRCGRACSAHPRCAAACAVAAAVSLPSGADAARKENIRSHSTSKEPTAEHIIEKVVENRWIGQVQATIMVSDTGENSTSTSIGILFIVVILFKQ